MSETPQSKAVEEPVIEQNAHAELSEEGNERVEEAWDASCLLYTSPSPRDATLSRMPSSA